jgi:hypothetical protein
MSSKSDQPGSNTGQHFKQVEKTAKEDLNQTSYAAMAARSVPIRTSGMGETNANDIAPSTTMEHFELVTVTKFPTFQARIFKLVTKILQNPTHREDPFTIKWKKALHHRDHKMNSKSSLYMIQKVLKVSDLRDYRNLLLKCPTIDKFVTFRDTRKAKVGFEVFYHDSALESPSTNPKDPITTVTDVVPSGPPVAKIKIKGEDTTVSGETTATSTHLVTDAEVWSVF